MKIAILGLGIVGSAQKRRFESKHEIVTYDPRFDKRYPRRQIDKCDAAIVCVGTPQSPGGEADISGVLEAVERLPGWMPCLIRSTVPPGTTDKLAKARNGFTAFCPEYMHEREGGSWKESADVPWIVLGGDFQSACFFRRLFADDERELGVHLTTAKVAELSKYVGNTFNAVKVTYVNECAAIADRLGIDWESVAAAWRSDPRIDETYTHMDGFPPGFGGRCLPKDLAALIEIGRSAGYEPGLLLQLRDSNKWFGGEV